VCECGAMEEEDMSNKTGRKETRGRAT